MELIMLGTGNAVATECYNTCFVLENNNEYFLVDGGGGNTLLRQLKYANIDWKKIHNIFVTHKHLDHIMGVMWLVRLICQHSKWNKYNGSTTIYGSEDVINAINTIAHTLLKENEACHIGKTLHLVSVKDNETKNILGHDVTFFDICSVQTQQFGFSLQLGENRKLVCCGDEPCNESTRRYVQNAEWLLHEAFCLYSESDIYQPYKIHHSTVKDACLLATECSVKNLLLFHTEDKNLTNRKELYTQEGTKSFNGNLFIPNDLERISIK